MRKLWTAVAAAGTVLVVAALPAAATGGWAITSLDAVPEPIAGQETPVGFTILQHGVTPVGDLGDESVVVIVQTADGETNKYAAREDGPTGHYVADVTFPAAGVATWSVYQGWFGYYELGDITVLSAPGETPAASASASASPAPAPTPATSEPKPLALRLLLPLVGLAGIGLLLVDLRRHSSAERKLAPG
jgi:hypothetical protein